jgi:hypothetical protein
MRPAEARIARGAVLGMMIKPSSLREELVMSLRTVVLVAAALIIGLAYSADAFARPAGMTRLHHNHHHGHTVHHSGQVRH